MFNNICVRQYLNSKHIHALSLIDPTWTARILLDRDDVSAALENGALAVTRCKPVNTTNVFTNHNVNNTCYSLLPLEIGDHIWFSVPGTKDLVSYSPEIHCPYMPLETINHLSNSFTPASLTATT